MIKNAQLLFKPRMKLPLILQDEVAECGHACIAMVSCFLGHRIDLIALRKITPPSIHGVSLREMNQLFEGLGFQTRALRVPLNALQNVKTPAILHWNMNHFVVLKKMTKSRAIIHDPAVGVRSIPLQEVSQSFTGVVLEVTPSLDFKAIHATSKLRFFDVLKQTQGVKKVLVGLLFMSLWIELLNLVNPLFMQYVTDQVVSSSNHHHLLVLTLGFMLMMLMLTLTEGIRGHLVLYLTMHLTEQFSYAVMRHLFKLPLSFFEARHKGDLQSKVHAMHDIQKKVGTDFVTTVLDGVMILLNLVVMLVYSGVLTSLVLLAFVFYVGIRYLSYRTLKLQMATSVYQHAKVASIFLESLQTMLPVKAFLKEPVRLNAWHNRLIDALNGDIAVERLHIRYRFANQLLTHCEYIAVVALGALLVLNSELSLGMLFAFLGFRQLFVSQCASFIHQLFEYRLISIQLDRLNDILSQEPEALHETTPSKNILGTLELQRVSFRYNPMSPPIVHELSLRINPGEKVAIVGASGCGKSTLLKMMMGLLKPTSGRILIDGIWLDDFGIRHYRGLVAAVMQEDALLSGSILENITFFEEEVDLEHAYHVARLVCMDDVIRKLPMGYETRVGDMGSTLSGGQKQRILLARALYKKPTILFLDEATSHLDPDNEQRINQALSQLNLTQVIVAHRKETIAMADRVISLIALKADD